MVPLVSCQVVPTSSCMVSWSSVPRVRLKFCDMNQAVRNINIKYQTLFSSGSQNCYTLCSTASSPPLTPSRLLHYEVDDVAPASSRRDGKPQDCLGVCSVFPSLLALLRCIFAKAERKPTPAWTARKVACREPWTTQCSTRARLYTMGKAVQFVYHSRTCLHDGEDTKAFLQTPKSSTSKCSVST